MPSKSKHAATSKKSLKDHGHTKSQHNEPAKAHHVPVAKPSAPAHPAGSGKHPEQTKAGAPLAETPSPATDRGHVRQKTGADSQNSAAA